MSESGLLGNAKIYDDRGRPIKTIFQNELLGTENSFIGTVSKMMAPKHL